MSTDSTTPTAMDRIRSSLTLNGFAAAAREHDPRDVAEWPDEVVLAFVHDHMWVLRGKVTSHDLTVHRLEQRVQRLESAIVSKFCGERERIEFLREHPGTLEQIPR